VDRYQIAVFERVLNFEYFVRILGRVFFHGDPQRICIAFEKRIVMSEIRADVILISLTHFSRSDELHKRNRRLFARDGCTRLHNVPFLIL
jgi:hypothetical protein